MIQNLLILLEDLLGQGDSPLGPKKSLILKLLSIFYFASPALSMHKRDSIFDLVDLIRSKTYFLCKRTFQVEEAVLLDLKKSLILKLLSIFYYASPALSRHERDSIFDLVDLIRSKTYFLCKRTFQVAETVLLDLKKWLIL